MPNIGDAIQGVLNTKSIPQRIENRIDNRMSKARNRPSEILQNSVPQVENRNVGGGTITGLLEAGIAVILEDTVGIPFGANAEVTDVEPTEDAVGQIYTVDVNAPTENMAQARAFLTSTTGFSSVLTDVIDVEDVEVLNVRPLRDTYQVKVRIED